MKFAFLASAFLLAGFNASAVEVSVDTNLRSSTKLNWIKLDKFKQSVGCYIKGKHDESNPLAAETIDGSLTAFDTVNAGSTQSVSNSLNVNSPLLPEPLGSIDVSLDHRLVNPTSEIYTFRIDDRLPFNAFRNSNDTDCVIHEYHWSTQSNRITGQYNLKIKMPDDSWILKLMIKSTGQAAPIAGRHLSDFNATPVVLNTPFYVWAQPGSTIELPVKLDVQSGGGEQGHIELTVTRPGLPTSQDTLTSLQSALRTFDQSKIDFVEPFINAGAAIAGHPLVASKVVGQIGIDPIREINARLFKIANSSIAGSPDEMNVKAMAAAVGYELAMALLDDLKVFCAQKSVYLAMTDQTVQRQGLMIAYFWITQSITQVQDLKFPEIETYLGELTRWENNKMKYSDVANDKVAQKQLVDSFKKLRQFSRLAFPVYGGLKATLQKVVTTFGTIGSDPEAISQIYSAIDLLAVKQAALQQHVQAISFKFTLTNNEMISASPILAELAAFEADADKLSQLMAATLKFYSVKTDGSSSTVLNLMTESLGNQVAIFERPLTTPFIEKIRLSFANSSRVIDLQSSYNQCLEVK